jgi:hypothetical protein
VTCFIRAERKLFNLAPTDVVYQGFSFAFDASVEEVHTRLCIGALLFVLGSVVGFVRMCGAREVRQA